MICTFLASGRLACREPFVTQQGNVIRVGGAIVAVQGNALKAYLDGYVATVDAVVPMPPRTLWTWDPDAVPPALLDGDEAVGFSIEPFNKVTVVSSNENGDHTFLLRMPPRLPRMSDVIWAIKSYYTESPLPKRGIWNTIKTFSSLQPRAQLLARCTEAYIVVEATGVRDGAGHRFRVRVALARLATGRWTTDDGPPSVTPMPA